MGVYIKGMEIPKPGRYEATIYIGDDGTSCIAVSPEAHDIGYWDEYSFISVPEHGRLIDADALPTYDKPIGKMMMFGGEYVYTQTAIDNAPTIITASGGTDNE